LEKGCSVADGRRIHFASHKNFSMAEKAAETRGFARRLGLTGPNLWALFPRRCGGAHDCHDCTAQNRRKSPPLPAALVFGALQRHSYKDMRMSKKDLIEAVAVATELPKDKAGIAVDAIIAHIEGSMKKGEEVRIPGFGTFKVTQRAARKARNPQTGVEMDVKASRVPKFQASKNLKELLN
jgi:DNA-binding protein HU-beta